MDVTPILRTNEDGTFFNQVLLDSIKQKNKDKIFTILRGTNPCQLRNNAGTTLLHYAALYGNDEFAQYLIDSGADVNAQNQMKQTPLMFAVDNGQEETVRVLLEADADVLIPDFKGLCVLGGAFRNKFYSYIVKAVLGKLTVESLKSSRYIASDVFYRDCPLYNFMQFNNAEITKILLESGSPVNAKEPFTRETALHLAVMFNCLENVKLLSANDADVNAKTADGRTPLEYVAISKLDESVAVAMIKVLIDSGATLIDPVCWILNVGRILQEGTLEMVRTVLQYPIDLQLTDSTYKSPLHYLAGNRNSNIFEELPNQDFHIDNHKFSVHTPLEIAIMTGNASSVKFLLDHGAAVNVKNYRGETPLFLATNPPFGCANSIDKRKDCVQILLEYGANPHIYTSTIVDYLHRDVHPGYFNFISDESLELIKPIFAKLVVLEASGRPIEAFMRNHIESYAGLKSSFHLVKFKLEEMKQIKIDHSVTLFDFLTADYRKFSVFARNEKLYSNLPNVINDYSATSYYKSMLNHCFLKVKWRRTLLAALNEILSEFCGRSLHDITEKIVDCLQREEWREF